MVVVSMSGEVFKAKKEFSLACFGSFLCTIQKLRGFQGCIFSYLFYKLSPIDNQFIHLISFVDGIAIQSSPKTIKGKSQKIQYKKFGVHSV